MPSVRPSRPLLVLLALVAGAIVAAPAEACSERRAATATSGGTAASAAPLVVGDSTLILVVAPLARHSISSDAQGCRQFDAGVALLAARRSAGRLPPLAVLALGANGPVSAAQIARARRITGPTRVLGLVTPRNAAGSAAAMRRAAARDPDRVLLIDWAAYSRPHGEWFGGDGLHENQAGADAFARLIRTAADPLMPPPAAQLRLPRNGSAGAHACGTVRRAGQRLSVFITRGASRLDCRDAQVVARRSALRPGSRWRAWDWARAGAGGGWQAVYQRRDRRVVVATRP